MALVFTVLYSRNLAKALYDFVLEAAQEKVRNEMGNRNALIYHRSVVFQQVGEASECVQLNIRADSTIPLSNWWLYFFIN